MTDVESVRAQKSWRRVALGFPRVASLFSAEEPLYYVLEKKGNKEIRDYKSFLVAYTEVNSVSHSEALTLGFWKLYDYFKNYNSGERPLDGGPPVSSKSQKMNLTTPIFESRLGSTWTVSLMIPSRYTMANVPLPEDHTIQIMEVPESIVAAIRVKGFTSAQTIEDANSELERWVITRQKFHFSSINQVAHYDLFPAFEFLRKTEIQIKLETVGQGNKSN